MRGCSAAFGEFNMILTFAAFLNFWQLNKCSNSSHNVKELLKLSTMGCSPYARAFLFGVTIGVR